ncbi:MAG TPA: carbon storage regulator [Bryobacteraceae bacterium]|nr:carbon storage regulator [Bryobacteraceae bacterium]
MLVMSRREGEAILIGDAIEIIISHIGRSRVKVGIRAPRALPVVAREVKLVRDENRAAAECPPSEALRDWMAKWRPTPQASSDQADERQ